MEQSKVKKIGAIVAVSVLFVMLVLVLISISASELCKLNIRNTVTMFLSKKTETMPTVNINWAQKYPFKEENVNKSITNRTKLENIFGKIGLIMNLIEKKSSEGIAIYEKFLEVSYLYDKAIGYSLVSNNNGNSRIKVGDYWCKQEFSKNTAINIEGIAKEIINFNDYLKEQNINFLYIQAPNKIEKGNNYISHVYRDEVNDKTDNLLNELDGKVDYIDIRNEVNKTGDDYLDLFFKTDHHWKPEAGFWCAGKIADELNNRYNFNINKEIYDINNYNQDVYENIVLGSDGRYVTLANTNLEDMSIITPKFNTDISIEIPENLLNKRGTFNETLIDYSELEIDKNVIDNVMGTNAYRSARYNAYMYADKALVKIHNENSSNGKKILVLKDSFGRVVAPYLALGVDEISVIDLRHFNGSLKSYIEEYKPDAVIMLYYPGNFGESSLWIYR